MLNEQLALRALSRILGVPVVGLRVRWLTYSLRGRVSLIHASTQQFECEWEMFRIDGSSQRIVHVAGSWGSSIVPEESCYE